MARSNLVLNLPDDLLAGLLTISSLQSYGYDALVADSEPDALGLL